LKTVQSILANPAKALLAGLGISFAILLLWLGLAGADRVSFVSFLVRWVHVATAMLWIGMIWFVNFIQLAAVRDADEAGRAALHKLVVPRVAMTMRHMSHAVLATGILLLITSGYMLDRLMFSSAVYIPPVRNVLLWAGALSGIAMWALLHWKIWPSLQVVLGDGNADAKAAARGEVVTWARVNLVLAVPVTFVMVAAAHLY